MDAQKILENLKKPLVIPGYETKVRLYADEYGQINNLLYLARKHQSGEVNTEENPEDEEVFDFPPLKELESELKKYIIGQDEQIKKIVTGIYRSLLSNVLKTNLLIVGGSGTGKTETIKQLSNMLDIPYTIEDATKFTKEGYIGASVSDMLVDLLIAADYDVEKAESGILVIDEIDKKVNSTEVMNDVSGASVLKSLLKIVEGTVVTIPDMTDENGKELQFDTSNLIVIFMGAFSGLSEIRDKRLNKKQIGFDTGKPKHLSLRQKQNQFLKKDFVKYGMTEEFMGRIDTIVEMRNLEMDDLVKILTKSRLSPFIRYQQFLAEMGISLSYEADIFNEIAKQSLSAETGARELYNITNYVFDNIVYDVLSNVGKYKYCILETSIVDDNTQYILN